MHQPAFLTALTALLASMPAAQAAIYTKNSPVLQVDAKSYDRLIAQSNHTSIVEFYAPWCGHCQNLKPAYEKAAKNLDGLAKVAAVDCDEETNKPLCGTMGIKGFPTLKIVRPGKKAGRPVVEDYNGPRTANGIAESVVGKINNHVTRVSDKDLDEFLSANDKPKAILFSEKGTTSALLKSLAIDFLDVISVAQVRSKETETVAKFGIDKFPAMILIPAGGEDHVVYNGELKKADMVEFLKQAGEPNPDPAPKKAKKDQKKGDKKSSKEAKKDEEKKEKAKNEEPPAEAAPEEPVADPVAESTGSNEDAEAADAAAKIAISVKPVYNDEMLAELCQRPNSQTCILAFVPDNPVENAVNVVLSLSNLLNHYRQSGRNLFDIYAVASHLAGNTLKAQLELPGEVEVVAINARRKWWKKYSGDFSPESVEAWVDALKMGEGEKLKLPAEAIVEKSEEQPSAKPEEGEEAKEASVIKEEPAEDATMATDPEPEEETVAPEAEERKHEEL